MIIQSSHYTTNAEKKVVRSTVQNERKQPIAIAKTKITFWFTVQNERKQHTTIAEKKLRSEPRFQMNENKQEQLLQR